MLKLDILEDILSYKRKYGSTEEETCIKVHLDSIQGMQQDTFGNRFMIIGEKPVTAFSCHTDTVHRTEGRQTVYRDDVKQIYYKADNECLGADDGAGIWLMMNMIAAKTPGLYLFHRGEECGGLGSGFISRDAPDLLQNIKHAIAFDRRGQTDIITHQSCGKCCSPEFAAALADELKMGHSASDRGSFTDTAQYTTLVPECTNVSVGYEREHTKTESLDFGYLQKLRDALLKVNFESLPATRDVTDDGFDFSRSRSYYDYDSYNSWFRDKKPAPTLTPTPQKRKRTRSQRRADRKFYKNLQNEKAGILNWADAMSLCINNPNLVAHMLVELNLTHTDIIDFADELDTNLTHLNF